MFLGGRLGAGSAWADGWEAGGGGGSTGVGVTECGGGGAGGDSAADGANTCLQSSLLGPETRN